MLMAQDDDIYIYIYIYYSNIIVISFLYDCTLS